MKTTYKFMAIALLGASLTSCNDWLDGVDNTSKVVEDVTWDTEAHVDMQVNQFYTYINSWGFFAGGEFGGNLTEALCDVFKYNHSVLGVRCSQAYQYATQYNYMSPNQNSLSGWSSVYTQVRYINQFLTGMKRFSTFSDELNAQWEAQARFFRAYVYFHLAKRYDGGIIYDSLPEGTDKAMSSAEELWDFIEADLDFAIANLPEKWDAAHAGRIDAIMAQAFKSRAMLFAERWQSAYDAAEAVVQSKRYSLTPSYANSWKGSNSESIIQYEYRALNGPSNSFDQYYAPVLANNPFSTGSCGVPTQEMVETFEAKDGSKIDWTPWHDGTATTTPPYDQLEPRFAATVVYPGSKWQGAVMDNSVDGVNGVFQAYGDGAYLWNKTCTGYFLRKLVDESHTDLLNTNGSQTMVVLRYAEVLLNMAEAAYRLHKSPDEYQGLMNQVRARVGLPAKTTTNEAWFADYRRERKVELSYENHLYWDMRRWRLADVEYNNYRCHGFRIENGEYEYVEVDLNDRVFNPKTYVFPIPYSEVVNNNLVNQYPQWQ
ncbi:MAG: RagB/SusD family nutrient uptake outer membrane protein [Muribaculaceae bacterium]|nr:RagB/SusD family nutrient uptake outer membrane protein [Muribaculaceae bacterium]